MSLWRATVMTLYEEAFPGALGVGVVGKALKQGLWALETLDIRSFASDKHASVDDTPAGGGPGMVMRCDVSARAIDAMRAAEEERGDAPRPLFYLSPRGRRFDQALARELAAGPGVALFAGRFEGLDERVIEARGMQELSLGDFVLAGGEVAAQAVIEAAVRLLPGVAGNPESLSEESFEQGLLEAPHYTRPRQWEGREIPEVLLGGDHAAIEAWRRAQAEELTRERRPDLWAHYGRDEDGETR